MQAAVSSVTEEGKGLREAARLYNVPVETLRRRVNGSVSIDCKPGPPTVLLREEEDKVAEYLITMADMGYGVNRETVMHIAYTIAEKTGRKHPFTGESAGRSWFEGFQRRHPELTIRTPLPLSYNRAVSASPDVVSEFFGKVGALYGRLNLFSKPNQIYNTDETGVSIVHRPGRVIAQVGRRTVYSISSAERGKLHTVLACVSASGHVLPPLMIYPRKRAVPDACKNGALPNTLFRTSDNGWINSDIFLDWLKFFVSNIPPTRPVLLIQDGHATHISINAIEFAKANNIHMLCLPSHTTHILQPLDVGVFKSFKTNFSKSCSTYISKHPGRVITAEVLSSLVAEAWPISFTTLNIMSGFRKCGLFPLNPSAVDDRRMAPSKALVASRESKMIETVPNVSSADSIVDSALDASSVDSSVFTIEQEELYRKRFKEGFDIPDPGYVAWLKINHPEIALSTTGTSTTISSQPNSASPVDKQQVASSDVLDQVLVLPVPREQKQRRREGVTTRGCCVTDMLDDLKENEKRQRDEKEMKLAKQLEKEENRRMKALEKEEKQKERQKAKEEKLKEKEAKLLEKQQRQREKEEKRESKQREKEEKKRLKEAKLLQDKGEGKKKGKENHSRSKEKHKVTITTGKF